MARRRLLTRWVFNWMEARTASAYALVSEAIWLVHGQSLDADRAELLGHLIDAATYLRTLLIAIDHDLESSDVEAVCEAIGRLGARHRPRLEWREDPNDYLVDGFRAARIDIERLQQAILRLRERQGPIVDGLERVLGHLSEAERLCRTTPGGTERMRA